MSKASEIAQLRAENAALQAENQRLKTQVATQQSTDYQARLMSLYTVTGANAGIRAVVQQAEIDRQSQQAKLAELVRVNDDIVSSMIQRLDKADADLQAEKQRFEEMGTSIPQPLLWIWDDLNVWLGMREKTRALIVETIDRRGAIRPVEAMELALYSAEETGAKQVAADLITRLRLFANKPENVCLELFLELNKPGGKALASTANRLDPQWRKNQITSNRDVSTELLTAALNHAHAYKKDWSNRGQAAYIEAHKLQTTIDNFKKWCTYLRNLEKQTHNASEDFRDFVFSVIDAMNS